VTNELNVMMPSDVLSPRMKKAQAIMKKMPRKAVKEFLELNSQLIELGAKYKLTGEQLAVGISLLTGTAYIVKVGTNLNDMDLWADFVLHAMAASVAGIEARRFEVAEKTGITLSDYQKDDGE
jgi:hypothetical protein